jgi:hypothetical protein
MQRVTVAFLLTLAVSLRAAPVGTAVIEPAPFYRSKAKLASGPAGTIAVWFDDRAGLAASHDLYIAFLGDDGNALRVQRLEQIPGPLPSASYLLVGADDQGFLIVWTIYPSIRALRINAEGVASPSVTFAIGETGQWKAAIALAWSGSAYALSTGDEVFLLDREGVVISGGVRFRGVPSYRYGILPAEDGWLMSDGSTSAVIRRGDFPPVGAVAEVEARTFRYQSALIVQAEGGYFAVDGGYQLHVQWLDAVGVPAGPEWVFGAPSSKTISRTELGAAAEGRALIVQYTLADFAPRLAYVRFEPNGIAQTLQVSEDAAGDAGELVSTPTGVLTVWKRDEQLHSGRIDSPGWEQRASLLSRSRRAQSMPVLVDGGESLLAAWVEESGTDGSMMAAIVDRNGALRSEPRELARRRYPFYLPRFAGVFSASKFFLVYQPGAGSQPMGQFIGTDGVFIGPPVDVFKGQYLWTLISAAYDGTDFFVASNSGMRIVRGDGTIVNDQLYEPYGANGGQRTGTILAWDGSRFLSLFRTYEWDGCSLCPEQDVLVTNPLSRDLNLDGTVADVDRLPDSMAPNFPAVAARDGSALAVWSSPHRSWTAAAFTKSAVLARRDLGAVAPRTAQPFVAAMGNEFLLSAGPTLARLNRAAQVIGMSTIDPDAAVSVAVPIKDGRALVFYVRNEDVPRLELKTMPLPDPTQPKRRAVR